MARIKGKGLDSTGLVNRETGENMVGFVDLMRSQSSVELKRDAKGTTTMIVKAYADTVEEAEKKAAEVFERLNQKFKPGD